MIESCPNCFTVGVSCGICIFSCAEALSIFRLPAASGRPLGEALESGEAKIQVAKALDVVDAEVAKSAVPWHVSAKRCVATSGYHHTCFW